MKLSTCNALLALAALMATWTTSAAFVPSVSTRSHQVLSTSGPFDQKKTPFTCQSNVPAALLRQRRSVAPVHTMGIFGLGFPEIALILVALAFLLGPEALANLARDTGKAAGEFTDELKNVPEEFKKGLEEGEIEARSRKAKRIKPEDDD
jgi:sec-independent protein translocase protein TatA